MKYKVLVLFAVLGLALLRAGCSTTPTSDNSGNNSVPSDRKEGCPASAKWVTNPEAAPDEIPLGENAEICQFHQFSWQWFLALMDKPGGKERVFEDERDYALLLKHGDSCTAKDVDRRLFVRMRKQDTVSDVDHVLPERIAQAESGSIIYDQEGNVVFYEVRFSRDQCALDPEAKKFPPGMTELKVSWRVIKETEKSEYVWINADIDRNGTVEANELLGMVGFHLARSTKLHPEFVWATFEHKKNAPDCQTTPAEKEGWSFTSANCVKQLPNSVDPKTCAFNSALAASPSPTPVLVGGTPTEICRVYHAGSKPGDNQYEKNVKAIDELNMQLTGPNGFITALSDSSPLAVLKNYQLVGALWVNDVAKPSTDMSNQRGSIQLANSTMETSDQQQIKKGDAHVGVPYTGTENLKPAGNCFACHRYDPGSKAKLSHIYCKLFPDASDCKGNGKNGMGG